MLSNIEKQIADLPSGCVLEATPYRRVYDAFEDLKPGLECKTDDLKALTKQLAEAREVIERLRNLGGDAYRDFESKRDALGFRRLTAIHNEAQEYLSKYPNNAKEGE